MGAVECVLESRRVLAENGATKRPIATVGAGAEFKSAVVGSESFAGAEFAAGNGCGEGGSGGCGTSGRLTKAASF